MHSAIIFECLSSTHVIDAVTQVYPVQIYSPTTCVARNGFTAGPRRACPFSWQAAFWQAAFWQAARQLPGCTTGLRFCAPDSLHNSVLCALQGTRRTPGGTRHQRMSSTYSSSMHVINAITQVSIYPLIRSSTPQSHHFALMIALAMLGKNKEP